MRRVGLFILSALVAAPVAAFDHANAGYAKVLAARVSDGLVDYAGLTASSTDLEAYLRELAGVAEAEFSDWTRENRIAFLVNAYNAATLQLVVDHYPVKTIKDIGGWRGPWKVRFVKLLGKTMTLDEIEHGTLRKEYREPLVHFALVCASTSCPALRSEPYRGEVLEGQLEDAARAFLMDSSRNRFDFRAHAAGISKIFKWFRSDFGRNERAVLTFLAPLAPRAVRTSLIRDEWEVDYLDYDWGLNER